VLWIWTSILWTTTFYVIVIIVFQQYCPQGRILALSFGTK
jgi:hypothetical protein